MNRVFMIGGVVALSILLFVVIYFFVLGDKSEDLMTQKNALETNLAIAEGKLVKEKAILDNLSANFTDHSSFGTGIQGQMKTAREAVRETNFMFINPDGQNPEFIIKNFPTGKLISDERKKINLLLLDWQKKADVLSGGKIDVKNAEIIKQNAQTIKNFIENLYQTVKNLTPENSGLSEAQINIYLGQLPSTEIIDTVFQQAVVLEVEAEVQTIQEQLTKVEVEIQQTLASSPPLPISEPISPAQTQTVDNEIDPDIYFGHPSGRIIIPTEGIIIQPGPPRLIQGSDAF